MSKVISHAAALIILSLFFGSISLADDRFIVNGDGTVTDLELRVMWAQHDNQSDILWKQAQRWIKFTFADTVAQTYDDWRLPTIKELQSLYLESSAKKGYAADCGHRVNIIPQIRISCILIWASETALGLPLVFNFNIGDPFTVNLNESAGCRALPVRSIK
jgi:hypothetical protein